MKNVIEIKNLYKKYPDFELSNISFNIPEGKIVGLIGENGSGKTTTIKSILNLININGGNIKVLGKNYNNLSKTDREQIGVVLDGSFFSAQFLISDIDIVMSNLYSNWDSNLYKEYITKFKLPANKNIRTFSNGMKMKLKIACALSHNSKVLILDEPTNGLDPIFRYEILDILSKLVIEKKISILLSTHITTDLEHIADEIVFINDGKILLSENKKKLFSNYRIGKCLIKEFDYIDRDDYTKYLKYKDDYLILIKDYNEFIKKYPNITIQNDSLEELMLMFIKGVDSDE